MSDTGPYQALFIEPMSVDARRFGSTDRWYVKGPEVATVPGVDPKYDCIALAVMLNAAYRAGESAMRDRCAIEAECYPSRHKQCRHGLEHHQACGQCGAYVIRALPLTGGEGAR